MPPLEIQREVVEILDNFAQLTAELTAELLFRKIKALIGDEARRAHMSGNLRRIAKTNALEKIYQLMLNMTEK